MATEPTVNLDELRAALDAWSRWDWSVDKKHISTVMNAAPALIAELAAARAEVERLRGFEECSGWVGRGSAGLARCSYRKMHHNEAISRMIGHEFVGGAFDADATTEGK